MKILLENLTTVDMKALGFTDPSGGLDTLRSLAGQGVTDDIVETLLPSLFEALRESPDPDRALLNFERWTKAVTSRYTHFQYLQGHPAALLIFFNVCGVSQFFSDILIRNPEYFEILANPATRELGKSGEKLYTDLSGFVDGIQRTELKLEAMRRFRQREILRIGARDILGLANMPATAREFSFLATACVQKCVEIAHSELKERYKQDKQPAFIVIGMGKLGGMELNYSSDIDLMFACADDAPMEYCHRLAEKIVTYLSRETDNGRLFRVDMRLRPEGRFGALVRTLDSYRSYYESWAESWERQSLLKANPIAGDARLCEMWRQMVTPFVYRRSVTAEFVEDIRHNKERIEQKARIEGVEHTNVKIGYGGIRDIEFAVQLLQLELGGRFPLLRTPSTLEALARLRQKDLITKDQADELSEDYQFLRTVEHRLQILYEMQTQSLPLEPRERRLLARRLGYINTDAFDSDYKRRTERVHQHCQSLFYGVKRLGNNPQSLNELLTNLDEPVALDAVVKFLKHAGFRDIERTLSNLRIAVFGGDYGRARPESQEAFLNIAPALISACARTGDPDTAMDAIESLALAMPNREQLYITLSEGDDLMDRLCRLGAGAPQLMQSLTRHLEWLDLLVSEDIEDPALKSADVMRQELADRVRLVKTDEAFWNVLALWIQRERLRIGARDLWGEINAVDACRELSNMADAALDTLLLKVYKSTLAKYPESEEALKSVAIISLGKLGGEESGYGSDWDILFVTGDDLSTSHTPALNLLAEALLSAGQQLKVRGAEVEIDARLRPEGRFGALTRSAVEYKRYYLQNALIWEKQVLIKARYAAGNKETAARYIQGVQDAIYSEPIQDNGIEEIRHMKRRIEAERLKPDETDTDIKLGHGGMSDIEFTAQLWQLRMGAKHSEVRVTGTVEALFALSACGAIRAPGATLLAKNYIICTQLRNRISLLGGVASPSLPSEVRRLRALAIGMGSTDNDMTLAEMHLKNNFLTRMKETRAVVEKLFYS